MEAEKLLKIEDELRQLTSQVSAMEVELRQSKEETGSLRKALRKIAESSEIFEKAFRVTGFIGDYVEFGAYRGDSIIQAYFAGLRVYEEIAAGTWDHSFDDSSKTRGYFQNAWNELRFIAFDSFQGMPESGEVDSIHPVFPKGTYACSEADFRANLRKYGIADSKVVTVPGFFRDTLNDATAKRLGLKKIAMLHIDSDLYESARDALEFCTPFFVDGTVIIFDEWYQFYGNPDLGEQRAFREWIAAHPEWIVTPFQKEGAFRNSFFLNTPRRVQNGRPIAAPL
ncbi:MAG TPA: TylF/MycF/NovP-related O-methyltransferase [Verrucomicrobiae bacterium]|nr:TylF/MycF/NovP-related O-methyltransferase [Verrucomicrobiae bacterium]